MNGLAARIMKKIKERGMLTPRSQSRLKDPSKNGHKGADLRIDRFNKKRAKPQDFKKEALWLMESSSIGGESKEKLKNFMNELEMLKNETSNKYGSKVEKMLRATNCECSLTGSGDQHDQENKSDDRKEGGGTASPQQTQNL